MTSIRPVGGTIPAARFTSSVIEAIREARTGHGRFIDVDAVNVDFTIRADGTDIRIDGLREKDPDHEIRAVGNMVYHHVARYTELPDGRLHIDRRWVARTSTGADDFWLMFVGAGEGEARIGTPHFLLEGVTTEEAPVVIASDLASTTYRCRILDSHLRLAVGDPAFYEGASSEALVVLDGQGLPINIASTNGLTSIEYSGWRTTPEVTAPDEKPLTAQEWYEFLYAFSSHHESHAPHR
jgi:hypothetical protein